MTKGSMTKKLTMKNCLFKKGFQLLSFWLVVIILCITSQKSHAQSCNFTTGPVSFTAIGGNQNSDYQTIYVVTDLAGIILHINVVAPEFEILNSGFYVARAINFRDGTSISGLMEGLNIALISGDDCYDVGVARGFTVCEEVSPCNHCLGETVTLTPNGGNNSPGFTTKYVLTDNGGIILSILDEPVFEDLNAGVYLAFAVNYETDKVVVGLEIGQNIADIESGCIEAGEPYVIGVCDQLKPTIFFDLNGCDITETAILQVGENFDSYSWSTGSTESSIVVSATDPATYMVTVTLANGCIGVGTQRITGNEISRIGDFVWEDEDADGRQDAQEPGINGVVVRLFADFDNNGIPDFPDFPSCVTTTTNHPTTGAPGFYEFTVYRASYVVGFDFPAGYLPTEPNIGDESNDSDIDENGLTGRINIDRNEVRDNIDAGFRTSTNICGSVFEDLDGDGRRDLTEEGLNDITINLYTADGAIVATTVTFTDSNSGEMGSYCFSDVAVLDYYVEIVLPDGRTLSEPNVGNDEAVDSDATGANGPGTTDTFSTSPGTTTDNVTFGIYTGGVVCGLVWQENEDGLGTENVYDEGLDSVIPNSQVDLLFADTEFIALSVLTDSEGRYCLDGIPAGTYKVFFRATTIGTDYVQMNQGNDPLLDSDVDINTSMTPNFFVAPLDSILGINAGLRLEALPIELTSFDGFWLESEQVNLLEWQTATEINNDYFEVQRVFGDGDIFETIAVVKGAGTSYEYNNYAIKDSDVARSGTYYYRLKQVDYNGGYEYSNVVAIDVLLNLKAGMRVFPNPAANKTHIELLVENADYAQISISDMLGREINKMTSQMLFAGKNLIELQLKDVPNGTYILTAEIGEYKQYEQIHIAR